MATSYVFNPFTSNFDQISTITLAAVGSTPNSAGATLNGQILNLEPADTANPGVLTATSQEIGGDKMFFNVLATGGNLTTIYPIINSDIQNQVNYANDTTVTSSHGVSSWGTIYYYILSASSLASNQLRGVQRNNMNITPAVLTTYPGTYTGMLFTGSNTNANITNVFRAARFSCSTFSGATTQNNYGMQCAASVGGTGIVRTAIALQCENSQAIGTDTSAHLAVNVNVAAGPVTASGSTISNTAKGIQINNNITATGTSATAYAIHSLSTAQSVFVGSLTASNISGTNTGDVTLAAVGSSPNGNAATLTGQVLNLEPADATNPGVVTTATQSFAGDKTFTGNISAANLSGTNTGDQTITLTGDVTGSGTGSFAATIANNVVTNGKLAQMPTLTIKGNNTGGSADPIDLTVSQVNTMLGGFTSPLTTEGDIIYCSATGTPGTAARLGIGTANEVLQTKGSNTIPSWEPIYQNIVPNAIASNPDFEVDTTGWATYANTAQSTPVTGTGGSPNITFTRSTSSPLRGAASGLITKDAANRQGEGVSYDFTIDSADTYRSLSIIFDYSVSSNFVCGENSDVRIWIYDVTNAQLIQPNPIIIATATSTFTATFQTTDSTSYRLIYHIATTNASSWTMQIDNVQVSAQEVVFASAISDWQDYTLTIGATTTAPTPGAVSINEARWRRVGDSMEIFYAYQQTATGGAAGSGTYLFPLPTGYEIDTSKISLSTDSKTGQVGTAVVGDATSYPGVVIPYNSTNLALSDASPSVGTTLVGSTYYALNANQRYNFLAKVPIVGWTGSVASANGRVFNISSVLANGTRVTSTPTSLGEYRCYEKDASAITGTDAAPALAPSASDGMLLQAFDYSNPGFGGLVGRWEIFVGKGKNVYPQYYETSGKSGGISTDYFEDGTGVIVSGVIFDYNPSNGVAIVDVITQEPTTTSRYAGKLIPLAGAGASFTTSCFFDLIVSENALAVTADNPTSEVAIVSEQYSSGTDAGTFTSGAWQTRVLNTITRSTSFGWISLASNQFTLSQGTYLIQGSAPAYKVAQHKTRIRNITASSDAIIGSNGLSTTTAGTQTDSLSYIMGTISVGSPTTFEFQHQCASTFATSGFGNSTGFGVNEVYAQLTITRLL